MLRNLSHYKKKTVQKVRASSIPPLFWRCLCLFVKHTHYWAKLFLAICYSHSFGVKYGQLWCLKAVSWAGCSRPRGSQALHTLSLHTESWSAPTAAEVQRTRISDATTLFLKVLFFKKLIFQAYLKLCIVWWKMNANAIIVKHLGLGFLFKSSTASLSTSLWQYWCLVIAQ